MLGRILVLVSLLYHCVKGAVVCTVTCEEGQFCFQSECRSCPYGSFVEDPIHQRTSCSPWTTKPTESHFVIARKGSSTFDVLWECEFGYVKSSDNTCLPRTTSHSSTTTLATTVTSMSTVPTTTALTHNSPEGNEANLIYIIIPVLLVIIVACVIIICRKHKVCSQQTHMLWELLHCNEAALALDNVQPDKAGGDHERLLLHKLPEDINFQFFYPIIQKLVKSADDDAAEKFLRALPDPSQTFQAEISIELQRQQCRHKERYLTHSCVEWATKNWEAVDHRKYIYEALTVIERTDIIQQIKKSQHDSADIDINVSTINHQTACQDLSEPSHPDRFKFWYILANKLDVGDAETLLYRLPKTDELFNARNFYDQKRIDHHGFQLSFVDTLVEWHFRHPEYIIKDCIREILRGMGRNDVIYELFSTNDVTEDEVCLSTNDVINEEHILSTNDVINEEHILSTNDVINEEHILSTNNVINEEHILSTNNVINDVPFKSRNDVVDGKKLCSSKAKVQSRTAVAIVT